MSNINIVHLLLQLKLVRPVDNEELLARLIGAGLDAPSHIPVASDYPSGHSRAVDSAVEAGRTAPPKLDSKAEVSDTEWNPLSTQQLHNILRKVPKMPRKLVEQDSASREVDHSRSSASPKADSGGESVEAGAEIESHGESTMAFKALMQCGSDTGDFQTFRAMAATVNSPSDFYLHKLSAETGHVLKNLMEDLNKALNRTPRLHLRSRSRKFSTRAGVLCCTQFRDGNYYRSLVLDTVFSDDAKSKPDTVQLFFLDFGDKQWVSSKRVFPLPEEFHAVPPQAIWCSLAYVAPLSAPGIHMSGGGDCGEVAWQEDTLAEFQKLIGRYNDEKILEVLSSGQLPHNVQRWVCG